MNNNRFVLVIVLVFIIQLLVGCNKNNIERYSDYTYLLGTIVKVTIYTEEDKAEKYFEEIFELISDMEQLLSKNIDSSEVSKINQESGNNKVVVSEDTLDLLLLAKEYSSLSEGKFDVTIGPLVKLWNIGDDSAKVPLKSELEDVLPLIDYNRININKETEEVFLMDKGMIIDLGGIAKGYVADRLVDYMEENKIESGIINLGGNIVTVGTKPDGSIWKIGLQNPIEERGKEFGVIECQDLSIVTSGIYERYLEKNGIKYHHILDPRTGYPFDNELASVTILSKYSVDGDGLSTAVFSMGLIDGYEFVEDEEDVDAIFITKENDVYLTNGAEEVFDLKNSEFMLKDINQYKK
ncbi:MAG: FAD:protein FMN transferase [Eubacteriales bacterium]